MRYSLWNPSGWLWDSFGTDISLPAHSILQHKKTTSLSPTKQNLYLFADFLFQNPFISFFFITLPLSFSPNVNVKRETCSSIRIFRFGIPCPMRGSANSLSQREASRRDGTEKRRSPRIVGQTAVQFPCFFLSLALTYLVLSIPPDIRKQRPAQNRLRL